MSNAAISAPPDVPVAVPALAGDKKHTFSVMIDCTSPAFGDGPLADRTELAKVLTILVDDIEKMKLVKNGTLVLRDGNGVMIGYAVMQGE